MPIVKKSDQFTIDSYKVTLEAGLKASFNLLGTKSTGIPIKATIIFSNTNPFKPILGAINNIGANNASPTEILGWGDYISFQNFYSVLSTEKPVYFFFSYTTDSATPVKTDWDLDSFGLKTDPEKPGDFEKV